MLQKGFFIFSISVVFLFNACHFFSSENQDDIVARVGENYLYKEDLPEINKFNDAEDSLAQIQFFVDAWVKEQLLLQKALENLSESQADFSKQLQTYKNSLLIYAYENLLIRQKLDTAVSYDEILNYYRAHSENFTTKEQLYQLHFVKFINTAPNQDSLKQWLFKSESMDKLQNYCTQFALMCHLDSNLWWTRSSLEKILPSNTLDFQFTDKQVQLSDTVQSILIHNFAHKKSGELAPLSYVKNKIIEIILNKRKLTLLGKAKQEIYEEATLNKRYERFN